MLVKPEEIIIGTHGTTVLGARLILENEVNAFDTHEVYISGKPYEISTALERNLTYARRNSNGRATLDNPPAIVLVKGVLGHAYQYEEQEFFNSIGMNDRYLSYCKQFKDESKEKFMKFIRSYAEFKPEKGGMRNIHKLSTNTSWTCPEKCIRVIMPDQRDIETLLNDGSNKRMIEKYTSKIEQEIKILNKLHEI